jgi:hypothetical protein
MKLLRIALVLGVLLIMTMSVASADSPPEIGPAMFQDHPGCWIFDVNMVWYQIDDCSPTISLITNSNTGMILWTAKAQLPDKAALPDLGTYIVTYENSGFACWFEEGILTTNYSILITPDGAFIASCHFRPDKWQPY